MDTATAELLHDEADLVSPKYACPKCGERDRFHLVWSSCGEFIVCGCGKRFYLLA